MRRWMMLMPLVLMLAGTVRADDGPLRVSIVEHPDRAPLGIARPLVESGGPVPGWFRVDIRVRVEHGGDTPLPVIRAPFWGYKSERFSVYAVAEAESGEVLRPCRPEGAVDEVILGRPQLVPGWRKEIDVPVCLPGVGRYRVHAVAGETLSSFVNATGERLELWTGSARSKDVNLEITAPDGVDREAYQAFGGDPLGNADSYVDLLRRFPESTYAAYVVWEKFARGLANSEAERIAGSVELGMKHQRGFLPCTEDVRPDGTADTYLKDSAYVECRDAWLEIALGHHPDIWFADEIRLRLALDRYILGDKEGCQGLLEELAAKGRRPVAEKARELLEAMRARGMLPGGPVPAAGGQP